MILVLASRGRVVGVVALLVATMAGARVLASPPTLSPLTSVTAIAAGNGHSCAVLASGAAVCWGSNSDGELGDGSTQDRSWADFVSGLSGVAGIAAGADQSCAVLSGGSMDCWGGNGLGEVGDGTNTERDTPVAVSGISTATSAAPGTGTFHACARLSDGTGKCWGQNAYGQLGDGATTNRNTPVTVSGLSNAVALAVGQAFHTCALLVGGSVECWGYNGQGNVGDGTTTERHTPVLVSGLSTAVSISAGQNSCAVLASGSAECWGFNGNGQNGDGTTTSRLTPVPVSGLSNAIAIAAGAFHTCALLSDGRVECWGWNGEGELGDGTSIERHTPAFVLGLSNAIAIAAGGEHTCALLSDGTVKCWGSNSVGQLGDGTTVDRSTPVAVLRASPVDSQPYNAGQGTFVDCIGDVPTDPPVPSAGGACFPLGGTSATFQIVIHDSTFSSNVAGAWSLQDASGARVDGVFCDATGPIDIGATLPGATMLRVWVGAYPQIKGAGCGLPNSGAATTGTIEVDHA